MAITTKERTKLRDELVGQGYSWEYIDEWQPKVTLYRHRTVKTPEGTVISPAGTKLANLPGNPDYVNRKTRQGLFQWPPSESCECRWCAEEYGKLPGEPVETPEKQEEGGVAVCRECKEEFNALTDAGALSQLRIHAKIHQGEKAE